MKPTKMKRLPHRPLRIDPAWRRYFETGENLPTNDSEAAIEARWRAHRDELIQVWIEQQPGTRPWAWWQYDAPAPRGAGESQRNYLRRHNLFSNSERVRYGVTR